MPRRPTLDDPRYDRPSLTTPDVSQLTGLSRRMLENYVKAGICRPQRASGASNADMLWTYEQAALATGVHELVDSGMTVEEVAQRLDGGEGLAGLLYRVHVAQNRASRRRLKGSVDLLRKIADTRHVAHVDGLYLRYIPQQWLALIPARDGGCACGGNGDEDGGAGGSGGAGGTGGNGAKRSALPGTRFYIRLVNELYTVAQVAGWSTTMDFGSIASLSREMAAETSYATLALASPPMPAATGSWVIDGGCYRVFDETVRYDCCDGESCFECARFGRTPTDSELERWEKLEKSCPGLWDSTVMVDDLREPYPCGMWAGYTRRALREREAAGRAAGEGAGAAREHERRRGPSLRPRLMPHEVRLPAGVTCCVMPAGTYLCRQCDEGGQSAAHNQLTGVAMSMPRREFTVEEELARFDAFMARRDAGELDDEAPGDADEEGKGPVIEPFAEPRSAGDPTMAGWSRPVTQPDISRLVLPVGTALAPQDGFCIRCDTLPGADSNAPTRYEFSMLVECPADMLPAAVREKTAHCRNM